MIVTAVLVSHDGERWLPVVIDGLRAQTRPVDRFVAVDTSTSVGTGHLLRGQLGERAVLTLPGEGGGFAEAVNHALDAIPPASRVGDAQEWLWLLHDDSTPHPSALAALVQAAENDPEADVIGPKIREWPSLRGILEVGLTLSATGGRETGLERGEYDQGQHDEVRDVLAVNTAGMLVRRSVYESMGGLDPALGLFGNDLDFGWRLALAGRRTIVAPDAVVFHAEAAQRGLRTTALTGRHPHSARRRSALLTLLANVERRRLVWQWVRLFFGSMLRAVGLLVARAPGEARGELAAVAAVLGRPDRIAAARRWRATHQEAEPDRARAKALLAPGWVPYRHGLDFVGDLVQAATDQVADVAERRRAARSEAAAASRPMPPSQTPASREGVGGGSDEEAEDEDAYLADSGWVVRFLTNPVALVMSLALLATLWAARDAIGPVVGGALSPVPDTAAQWWRLHTESWHALGTGSEVPAPAYLFGFSLAATLLPGGPVSVVSALMVLAVPTAAWGAWRLLRVLGHLVDPAGLPRWVLVWGSLTYALVPATSGAWGAGRFGVVALAAFLPFLAHAAIGFADPEPDRRWRAAWRTALLTAGCASFVPGVWLFAVLATALVLGGGLALAPALRRSPSSWAPPVVAVVVVPVLLAPWFVPMITTGSWSGLLLEAGGLPGDQVSFSMLVTGRLGETGAPGWVGAVLGVLAVIALVPLRTRIPVLICWLVAFSAASVAAVLAAIRLDLSGHTVRPGLGLFVVVLSGLAVVAVALGADAYLRRLAGHHGVVRRAVAVLLAAAALAVPAGGLAWWLSGPQTLLAGEREAVVPAYMLQSSEMGDEHGVLVVSGSLETGLEYRIRRGDGTTLGEDEIIALTPRDEELDGHVRDLASAPTSQVIADLGALGIEYVVLASPADGRIASGLDSTTGLVQASTPEPTTRAWRVDRELGAESVASEESGVRPALLGIQALAVLAALVMAAPTIRRREG